MASSSSSSSSRGPAAELNEDQLAELFSHLTNEDRGVAAAVSHGWCQVERRSRLYLTINNCYATDPMQAVKAFPNIKFLTVKGMPRFADFGAFPPNWGADAVPWINAARTGWRNIREIAFGLEHIEVLRLILCDGFSSAGLAHIATKHGRHLRVLELEHRNNRMRIPTSWLTYPETPTTFSGAGGVQMIDWISYFPTSYPTVLQTINISCLTSTEHNFNALERLVSRSPQLKKLMLCDGIPLDTVARIVRQAPNLMELGIGKINTEYTPSHIGMLRGAIAGCNNLVSLHGSSSPVQEHHYIEAFHCACGRLRYINLYGANPPVPKFKEFITKCGNLQKLWVMDLIRDDGLAVVAASCKKLQELRVFPHYPDGPFLATQVGLLHISNNCPDLTYILYWSYSMTNEALKKIAKAHPSLTCFRLGIYDPKERDCNTGESFDDGLGAIVRSCKDLKRLSLGGYLTDHVFKYIGDHAKSLHMFSTAFAGTTEQGLHDVLQGCKSLKKMDIKGCPFGNKALLQNTEKLKTMRSFFLSGCPPLTVGGCRELAKNVPGFAFEILMNYDWKTCPHRDELQAERLFVYPTISNQRDTPNCVRSFWYPLPR